MKVLVTGGAGYIGSHTVVELAAQKHDPIVLDNFINSKPGVLKRLANICQRPIPLYRVDLQDLAALKAAIGEAIGDTDPGQVAVAHFAGFKAVAESVRDPLRYYHNNVVASLNLVECMQELGLSTLVFSSSASVYDTGTSMPVDEESRIGPNNPYGQTKAMVETILQDQCRVSPDWSAVLLRYFNPAGAHPGGNLGEDPPGPPNNLMPVITGVASGSQTELVINGDDWPTGDGTCIRDYIHVVDLAKGHVAALNWLKGRTGWRAFNLGTGHGYSVLDMLQSFEETNQVQVRRRLGPRRDGDVATIYSNPQRAAQELNWSATASLADMCRDAWRWEKQKPGWQSCSAS